MKIINRQALVQRRFYIAICFLNIIGFVASACVLIFLTQFLNNLNIGKFTVGKNIQDWSWDWFIITTAGAFVWMIVWLSIAGRNKNKKNIEQIKETTSYEDIFQDEKIKPFRYSNNSLIAVSILTIIFCGINPFVLISGILGLFLVNYRQRQRIGTNSEKVIRTDSVGEQ